MALAFLNMLFVIMTVVSISGIAFLYFYKEGKLKNIIFYLLSIWSLGIAFINITSFPSNYLTQIIIGFVLGLIALLAVIIKFLKPDKKNIAYILVSISILLSLGDLFFF